MTAAKIEMMNSNGNIILSNCFRPININETFTIEATSNASTNNNGNLDSKMKDVNNVILQLKDLIDQTQKLLHNFQNNVNVAFNPELTIFNVDAANYLKNQGNSQNHSWEKGTTLIIGDLILSGLGEYKMSKRKSIKVRTFPTLIIGDLILSGLGEYKMSKRKSIKVRTFPGATIGDTKFFIIPHLRKSPDKIVLHVGTNDAPHVTLKELFNAIKDLESSIQKYTP